MPQTHMAYNTAKLDELVGQYIALKRTAEDLLDDLISKKRRGKELKPLQVRRLLEVGILVGGWTTGWRVPQTTCWAAIYPQGAPR